jgi:hypothetical protein
LPGEIHPEELMFGYVTADLSQLTEEEKERYRGCYCGLCYRMGKVCSQGSRLALTYDMTFLILVLHSVYGGEEKGGYRRCIPHPLKKHPYWESRWTDYGAWMNVALGYYKCQDDWQDERKKSALFGMWLLKRPLRKAEEKYPRQCETIKRELQVLSQMEQEGNYDPDKAAASFGRLMAALFVIDPEDEYSNDLAALGDALGRYIYLVDARIDLADDLKAERYNPLTGLANLDLEPVLTMFLSDGAAAAERLPLQTDKHIIFNILYSGVWLKYQAWKQKREEERHG